MDVMDKLKALGLDDAQMWAVSQVDQGIDNMSAFTVLRAFVDLAEEAPAILASLVDDPVTPQAVKASAATLTAAVSAEDADREAKALAFEVPMRVSALLDGALIPAVNPEDLLFGLCSLTDDGTDYVPTSSITGLQERLPTMAAARFGADVVKL